MRLNRFLSASGYISRRRGETVIREGRVRVNGEIVTDPAMDVDPSKDEVKVDGNLLHLKGERRYYILNKPTGYIVTKKDTHRRRTVYDLLGEETQGVFPVGRLDADTSGVLIFTDDGELAYRLTHPSWGASKTYRATVEGRITQNDKMSIEKGIELEDGMTSPAKMRTIEANKDTSVVELTIHEGRKRQVRRMLDAVGHPVRILERTSFAGISAGDLPIGKYRPLSQEEVLTLKKAVVMEERA